MRSGTANALDAIIHVALGGQLDETYARRLHALGPEAVAVAMFAVNKRLGEQDAVIAALQQQRETPPPSPSTPSGDKGSGR